MTSNLTPKVTNYRKPFSYVPSMEPVVLVDSFSGLLRVVKIALEDARTLKANLQRRKMTQPLTYVISHAQ